MKLTVGTQRLQAMLNKAIKGAGNNKLIPKTSLIAIQLKDGILSLTTTDNTHYLSIVENGIIGDDFYVVVQVDLLAKLVARMTSQEVTLEVADNCLNVIGNGTYQIDIPVEDDGAPVHLSNPIETFNRDNKIGTVNSSVIDSVLAGVKPALAVDDEYDWFTCYYVKDRITATDTYTVADYNNGFLKEPKLIRSVMMDLVGLLVENIDVYLDGDKMLFESSNGAVFGVVPAGIENYSIDAIQALVQQEFDYSCKITKSSLLRLLDRISLFVGEYDNGKITLSFGTDGLNVTSKYATETINYTDAEKAGEFECNTDVNTLITQVKAQAGSELTIEYGKDNALKIVDGDMTSVVALLED